MFKLKNLLLRLDKALCSYFGLTIHYTKLDKVTLVKNKIVVSNHESHKRHVYQENWQDFSKCTIKTISEDDKSKLGIALGKTLADNLVISFEKSKVHI